MIKKIYQFLLFLIIVRLSSATDNNADSVKTVGRVDTTTKRGYKEATTKN